MISLTVRATLKEEALGSSPGDPKVYEQFIIDKKLGEHVAKMKAKGVEILQGDLKAEELEAIRKRLEEQGLDEAVEKSSTVFPRDHDGNPMVYDYQLKGFFKEANLALLEINGSLLHGGESDDDDDEPEEDDAKGKKDKKPKKPETKAKRLRLTHYLYKGTIDREVFVSPRRIRLNMPEGTEIGWCERPLRAETKQGPRVALARSETVPIGTTMEFTVCAYNHKLMPVLKQMLLYGALKGLGQWRSGGKGSFEVEVLEEVVGEGVPPALDITKMKVAKKKEG